MTFQPYICPLCFHHLDGEGRCSRFDQQQREDYRA